MEWFLTVLHNIPGGLIYWLVVQTFRK